MFTVQLFISRHMSRLGIDIGNTNVLLYARLFLGRKYIFDAQGNLTLEKQWYEFPTAYAYHTVVRDISSYCKVSPIYNSIHDIFVPETVCFMLGHPYYGTMGEVHL